jgi:aspartate/methionine/tyrosine aminotransferase
MIISERIKDSPTLMFSEAVKRRKQEGGDIISMGIGEPDIATPKFLTEALVEAARGGRYNGYAPSNGIDRLRSSIADDLKERRTLHYQASQVMVTAGAKQAIQLILMSVLRPGDEVVYFTPCYVSYLPQILLAEPNAVPVPVALDPATFEIDLEALRQAITSRTRVIVLNAPHNPTGKVFDRRTLEQIADLALENGIYVILDDVYELLNHGGKEMYCMATEAELEKLVFYVSSFSKTHAVPGWRAGYLCAPKQCVPVISKMQQHMNTSTCSVVQAACLSIFENGFDFLHAYNVKLKERSEYISRELSRILGYQVFVPDGGFFYFVDVSSISTDSNSFCAALMAASGVALTPGIAFGDDWDSHVRLSFGISDQALHEGMARISAFINEKQN